VTYPDRKPRAKWWVYKAYADITGTLVRVNGTPEVTAVAGKDTTARTAHILLGKKAGKKESLAVKMTGMQDMSYLKDDQGKVRIVVQRIPNAGWKAVEKPLAVRDEIVPLADAMEVILPDFGPSEAFVVSLSPAR
jgi:hypothetical protein